MTLGWGHALIVLVAISRLIEVAYAQRKTASLLRRGGIETGAGHYPLFVLLHGGWLAAMFVLMQPNPAPEWPLLALFAVLQPLRWWTFHALGDFATVRVITLPGASPVTRGPYRFVRHPSYLIAAAEVFVLPLALGLPWVSLGFGCVNLVLIAYRIRVENEAWRRAGR